MYIKNRVFVKLSRIYEVLKFQRISAKHFNVKKSNKISV